MGKEPLGHDIQLLLSVNKCFAHNATLPIAPLGAGSREQSDKVTTSPFETK